MTEREVGLKQWLEKIGGSFGLNLKTLRPASSDAGFRSYFRIDGDGTTYIVMDSSGETGNVKPFIFVDDLFAKQGLNVPKIYAQDVEQGFLLLSDLGTQTYLDVLSEDNASRLMDDATTALVKLQKNSKPGVLPDYSEELLRSELELFPEWYVKRHLNMEITPQMRSMFDKMFDHIIEKNLAQSFVYVHRDYMPRNLMLEEKDNPGIIDFQDAVYGPVSYDIACLCRDAFISWSEAQILDWTIRYWDKARKEGIPVPADFGVFWEDVEWMALQRHLKVLGIFARLNYRDGKTKYLGDTPRFLNYVQKTASRFDALRPLSRFINQISGIEETVGYSF